ncbi:MAG: cell division protein ZapA [Mariprofundaceae bacterium]|nr:cell division protein ZapA [Mariprofundaceae bacterium]
MNQIIQVTIMGRDLSIRTDDDPKHLIAAAKIVQDKVDKFRHQGMVVSSDRMLSLVALNLAGELIQQQEEQQGKTETLKSSLDTLALQSEQLEKASLC